jgi:AcrR family transcriptional regulator
VVKRAQPQRSKPAEGEDEASVAQIKYPRRTERRKRTRAKILQVAARQFSEAGYGPTTMQSIADETDIHVTTLFMHFNSKSDLALSLVTTAANELRKRASHARGEVGFFEFFRREVHTLIEALKASPEPGLMFWNTQRGDSELAFAWTAFEREQRTIYAEFIAAEYGLDRANDYRPDLVVSLVLSSIILAHKKWSRAPGKLGLEGEVNACLEIAETAARIMLASSVGV